MRHSVQNVLYAPIFANRRLALAGECVLGYMAMPSLLAWRATSRDNYLLATKRLRALLLSLVSKFFPDPHSFLAALTQWGGLIVGEAALGIVVNDPSLSETFLEVAVGNLYFERFIGQLARLLPFGTHLLSCINKPPPPSFPLLRNITRIVELHLTTGVVVHVYESSTPSACDVLCGAWTTALMNFATASSFGCAYPRLTLTLHGFICDGRTNARRWLDNATHRRLETKGFRFSHYSPDWASFSRSPYSTTLPTSLGCGKSIHVCPFQGRYFGNRGSLVLFFDGFFVDLGEMRDLSVAPYGPMTAWRVPTQGTCEGHCLEDDSVLPAHVLSMIVHFFEYGPVTVPSYDYRPVTTSSPTSRPDSYRANLPSLARRASF